MEIINVDLKNKGGIISCSPNILRLIREKFSIKNPSYMMRRTVPRLYSITPIGAFQIGLWGDIETYIRSLHISLKITTSEQFDKMYRPSLSISTISHIEGFEYYDYQIHTLNEFLKSGRGISLLATGAGKSLVAGGLCKTLLDNYPNFKILIVVPTIGLLNQLYESFINEFDIDSVTRWGDKKTPDLNQNIIIANSQILVQDIAATLEIVQNFDVVLVDEVHTLGEAKNQISKVVHNIITPHKFGLTGTLPDSLLATWNVIGKIGPILYEKNSYALRQQNTISEVEVKIILCKHDPLPVFPRGVNPTDAYNAEYDFVMNCAARNDIIVKLAKNLIGNALIVVDRLQYIDNLKTLLMTCGKKILIITGDTPSEERTLIQNTMDNEDGIVCLAMSKCFSTGISINNLHYAILSYMGKGGVKTVQTIGRTVRKHSTKSKAVIFDIADNLEYSYAHLRKRIQIYTDQKIDHDITKKIIK